MPRRRATLGAAALLSALLSPLLTGCSDDGRSADPGPSSGASSGASSSSPATSSPTSSPTPSPTPTPTPTPTAADRPVYDPNTVLGAAAQRHRGDRLTLGAVREETSAYTSYDVTYRGRSTTPSGERSFRISGVLNVPTGAGPFPAVVLAHGYIDPAVYVRGQGMTRERGYLAQRGYVALHVDYRNHAESDDDPLVDAGQRLGYSIDVVNAVHALRGADLPVDDERVALMGRSMGGGVVLKALEIAPGLVSAASPWASVSSIEAENYEQFIGSDDADPTMRDAIEERFGTPEQAPQFWRRNSSRPYFGRITEPILLVHGRNDDTCPPAWAEATQRALLEAGVDSRLAWYDDGHAFGPAFDAAMDRTVDFFDARLT